MKHDEDSIEKYPCDKQQLLRPRRHALPQDELCKLGSRSLDNGSKILHKGMALYDMPPSLEPKFVGVLLL